jgi:hypothetical protein
VDEHPWKGIGRPDPDRARGHLAAGRIALADGRELRVTTHCVDRFWERAASGCTTFAAALARLRALAAQAGTVGPAPPWAGDVGADQWIALTDDIGLVVHRGRAVTCLVRGGMSDAARAQRNARRRRRPARRGRSGADRRREDERGPG